VGVGVYAFVIGVDATGLVGTFVAMVAVYQWVELFVGVIGIVMLLVLLIEFRVRMKYLPQTSGRTFKQFLLQLIKIDWRRLARSDEVSP